MERRGPANWSTKLEFLLLQRQINHGLLHIAKASRICMGELPVEFREKCLLHSHCSCSPCTILLPLTPSLQHRPSLKQCSAASGSMWAMLIPFSCAACSLSAHHRTLCPANCSHLSAQLGPWAFWHRNKTQLWVCWRPMGRHLNRETSSLRNTTPLLLDQLMSYAISQDDTLTFFANFVILNKVGNKIKYFLLMPTN